MTSCTVEPMTLFFSVWLTSHSLKTPMFSLFVCGGSLAVSIVVDNESITNRT